MCIENKNVFDVVDPGCSISRGTLLYEISESIFQVKIEQRKTGVDEIGKQILEWQSNALLK